MHRCPPQPSSSSSPVQNVRIIVCTKSIFAVRLQHTLGPIKNCNQLHGQ